jgi:hypothetical protein
VDNKMKTLLFYAAAVFFALERLVSLYVNPYNNGLNLLEDVAQPAKLTEPLKAKGASA